MQQSRDQMIDNKVAQATQFFMKLFDDPDLIPVMVLFDKQTNNFYSTSPLKASSLEELLSMYLDGKLLQSKDIYKLGN